MRLRVCAFLLYLGRVNSQCAIMWKCALAGVCALALSPLAAATAIDISGSRAVGASALLQANRREMASSALEGKVKAAVTAHNPVATAAEVVSPDQCVDMPLSLCAGGEDTNSLKIMAPEAVQKGLRALYTFDDALGYDSAAHQDGKVQARFAQPPKGKTLQFAPGVHGVGSSLKFDGKKGDFVRLPAVSDTENEMTVGFWLFLRNTPIATYNFLLRKGNEDVLFTPTIQVTKTRQLHVRLREINDDNKHGHSFESFARIPWERWTHISLVLQGQVAQIYVNGIKDNLIVMNDNFRVNDADWYLGGMPGNLGVRAFVDDFRVYNIGLQEGKIQALAHGGLGSYSPHNIKFLKGGEPVPCPQASKCGDQFHVCTWQEQKGGALAAARANGMFQGEADKIQVWTEDCDKSSNEKGLVICCRNTE